MTLNPDFFKFVGLFRLFPRGSYQDLADYLASYISAGLYVLLCIVLGARSLVGTTIQCFVPREFSSSWEDYAEQLCWVEGTYWAREGGALPPPEERRSGRMVYYQWVPLFFVGMTVVCYLPDIGWRMMLSTSGVQFRSVAEHLRSIYKQTDNTSRQKILHESSHFLWQIIGHSERSRPCNIRLHCGSQLFLSYLVYKLASIGALCFQLVACWQFIGYPSILFGWHLAAHLLAGNKWTNTGNFPRVAFCDVNLRALGASRSYTLQCALPMNMVNEVFFLIIWFYLVAVLLFSMLSLITWIFVMLSPGNSMRLVRCYLKQSQELIQGEEKKYLSGFVKDFFHVDGIFLLRMMTRETGHLLCSQLTGHLWRHYKDDCRKRADGCSEMDGINHLTMV